MGATSFSSDSILQLNIDAPVVRRSLRLPWSPFKPLLSHSLRHRSSPSVKRMLPALPGSSYSKLPPPPPYQSTMQSSLPTDSGSTHILNTNPSPPGTPNAFDGISSSSKATYMPRSFPGEYRVAPPPHSQPAITFQNDAFHPNVCTRHPAWIRLRNKWQDCTIVAWCPSDDAYLVYVTLLETLVSVGGTDNLYVSNHLMGPADEESVAVDVWPYSVQTCDNRSIQSPRLPVPFHHSQIEPSTRPCTCGGVLRRSSEPWVPDDGDLTTAIASLEHDEWRSYESRMTDFIIRHSYENAISDIAFMGWGEEVDGGEGGECTKESTGLSDVAQSHLQFSHHPSPSHLSHSPESPSPRSLSPNSPSPPSPLPIQCPSPTAYGLRRSLRSFFRALLCLPRL